MALPWLSNKLKINVEQFFISNWQAPTFVRTSINERVCGMFTQRYHHHSHTDKHKHSICPHACVCVCEHCPYFTIFAKYCICTSMYVCVLADASVHTTFVCVCVVCVCGCMCAAQRKILVSQHCNCQQAKRCTNTFAAVTIDLKSYGKKAHISI